MKPPQTDVSIPASASESKTTSKGLAKRFSDWNAKHPVWTIVLVSLLAVVINCYPIIFCGQSYVSPTCSGGLDYTSGTSLPGVKKEPTPHVLQHGSDTEAMMWWGVPIGFLESRSLMQYGEIPLWNRYSHAGDTLIGQALSMLGDPLQLIVIFGRGSAWAWDIKFLVAKFLFCVGFGLLILRLLESRPLSIIYTALAAYCGAYFYINNHPVFFVLTYAPWILLSAIELLDLKSNRYVHWGLIWLLANFACFNAGHIEVAVLLIGGLNLAAVAYALAFCRNVVNSVIIAGRMAVGTLLFLGLTAPMWISFLVALNGAYTAHSEVKVTQLPLTGLPGAFDDLFYLLIRPYESIDAIAPGTSLLVLTGCILSVLNWRQLKGEPFFWVNITALILWGGCIFGWVPVSFLSAIPLLNRVGHNYTDFSYLLVIHLTIQSAYGFKCLAKVETFQRAARDLAWVGGIFAGLMLVYYFGTPHRPIPWNYFLCAEAGAIGSPLLFVFLKNRNRHTLILGWVGIIILGFIPNFRFGLYYDNDGNDTLLMFPGPRMVLNAPSEAINKIKMDKSEAFRVDELQNCLIGDYPAVYEIEGIRSCAPLSNREFINLIRNFPGVLFHNNKWMINVIDPFQAQPLLNMLNVKYLLADPSTKFEGDTNFNIIDRSDFLVVENLQVWPRAFFSNQIIPISSTKEFIKQLLENAERPFVAISNKEIEKQPDIRRLETTRTTIISPATNYQLLPNSTAFDIHASSAGVVCLTEEQAKDFTAKANNEPKEVLTVNRAFKGIYLDKPGDYHIEFIYRPRYYKLACTLFWISAVSAILLATTIVFRAKARRKAV
jgi:hypothetical protein